MDEVRTETVGKQLLMDANIKLKVDLNHEICGRQPSGS